MSETSCFQGKVVSNFKFPPSCIQQKYQEQETENLQTNVYLGNQSPNV